MGPKKKKEPLYIEGVNTTVLTREQLEKFALALKETLEKEREERNYFQIERDKIRTFWDITKQQLDDCRAELLIKEKELEEKENMHQDESKLIKQKMKHLIYEHHRNISELRADSMLSLQKTQEDFDEQEMAFLTDKKHLKENLIEQQRLHQEELRNMSLKFSEELSQIRSNFKMEAKEIEAKYEDNVQTLRSELALRHSMEITEIDERKNKHISELMLKHEKIFSEMKNYYNCLILNNLTLISNMKEQMEDMKCREDRVEKSLKECQKTKPQNRNGLDPLEEALEENKELKRELASHAKDKAALSKAKKKIIVLQKEIENYKWEKEVLELRLIKYEEIKSHFENMFFNKILDVQNQYSSKNALLETKLKSLLEYLEQREVLIAEFLRTHKSDYPKLIHINMRIDKILAQKNSTIEHLEYELARVCKAHDDAIQIFQGKLEQYGIPSEEIRFVPLRTAVLTAKGPAGLITFNK